MTLQFKSRCITLALITIGWASFCLAQIAPQNPVPTSERSLENGGRQSEPGSISGTVVDQSGAVIAGAHVRLTRTGESQSLNLEVLSGGDGQFSFANISPGPFQLTITSAGFATQTSSGVLGSGEKYLIPLVGLAVAAHVDEIRVGLSPAEAKEERSKLAEEQIKVEEKQRVFGVLPNFYVSYIPDAVPLTSKQKFKLAGKTVIDPFTFVFVGGAAGVEQAQNHFREYGQGAQGYGKSFGAGYADTVAGTVLCVAFCRSLVKQKPRIFYKGVRRTPSPALYAIGNSVICKGDNGRWQANYSNMLGSLAAGGISNLYYPAQDRDGAGLTFENAAIGIGATAVGNLFQEFVVRKLTPKLPKNAAQKP